MKRMVALVVFIGIAVGIIGPGPAKAGPESAAIWAGVIVTSTVVGGCAHATARPETNPMSPSTEPPATTP